MRQSGREGAGAKRTAAFFAAEFSRRQRRQLAAPARPPMATNFFALLAVTASCSPFIRLLLLVAKLRNGRTNGRTEEGGSRVNTRVISQAPGSLALIATSVVLPQRSFFLCHFSIKSNVFTRIQLISTVKHMCRAHFLRISPRVLSRTLISVWESSLSVKVGRKFVICKANGTQESPHSNFNRNSWP